MKEGVAPPVVKTRIDSLALTRPAITLSGIAFLLRSDGSALVDGSLIASKRGHTDVFSPPALLTNAPIISFPGKKAFQKTMPRVRMMEGLF